MLEQFRSMVWKAMVAAYGLHCRILQEPATDWRSAKYQALNMTTTDMIPEIHDAFELLFPDIKSNDERVTRQEHTVYAQYITVICRPWANHLRQRHIYERHEKKKV